MTTHPSFAYSQQNYNIKSKFFMVVVDGTASLRTTYSKLRSSLIDPLLVTFHEKFCAHQSSASAPNYNVEYAIIIFRSSMNHSESGVEVSPRTTDLKLLYYWLDSICFDGGGYRYSHSLAGALQTACDLIKLNPSPNTENHLLLISNSDVNLTPTPFPSFSSGRKNARELLIQLVTSENCTCSLICPREIESLTQMWVECTKQSPIQNKSQGVTILHALDLPPAPQFQVKWEEPKNVWNTAALEVHSVSRLGTIPTTLKIIKLIPIPEKPLNPTQKVILSVKWNADHVKLKQFCGPKSLAVIQCDEPNSHLYMLLQQQQVVVFFHTTPLG